MHLSQSLARWRSKVKPRNSRKTGTTLMGLILFGLSTCTANLIAQTTEPNPGPTAEDKLAAAAQDLKIQHLQDQLEAIQQQLIQLREERSSAPEAHHFTTTKASVAAPAPAPAVTSAPAPAPSISEAQPDATDPSNPHSEPFAFADFSWLNGNARTKDTPYATKFFSPEIRSDVSYTYDFRHPQDDTIVGSSEVFRSSEVTLTDLG